VLIDLHVHTTRYSPGCSVLDPLDLVPAAKDMGLDGVAITDHNSRWDSAELDRLQGQGVFVATGREVDCAYGLHVLVFGLKGRMP
jgi:predicted metal-dependent phosphoesterase TrpH